jgi:circadian clock protein KaiC
MKKKPDPTRVQSGVGHFDEILHGGLPKGSVTVVAGAPGSGKTILCQQICFHNASARNRVLSFTTLSEPVAKTLRHVQQFSFFDRKKVGDGGVHFVDLGVMMRTKGLEATAALIMQHVKKVKPAILVIDSFKVFDDLATSKEELRKFIYEIAINLMAWETTALILGEYGPDDYENSPLFSIVDGLIVLSQQESLGERQRFLRVVKMRGTDHSRDDVPFVIDTSGIEIFAPRLAITRDPGPKGLQTRCKTHINKLDEILGPGIPWGSSLLIAGVAGTGKTVLSL